MVQGRGFDFGTEGINLGEVLGSRFFSIGSDTIGAAVVINRTLEDGVDRGTALKTDIVDGYIFGAKSDGDSDEVVIGGEYRSVSNGGFAGKAH